MRKEVAVSTLLVVVLGGCVAGARIGDEAPRQPMASPQASKPKASGALARDGDLRAILKRRDASDPVNLETAQAPSTSAPLELVLSGPSLPLRLDHCADGRPFANRPRTFWFEGPQDNSTSAEMLPAGTLVSFSTSNGKILGNAKFRVPDSDGPDPSQWTYPVTVQSDALQSRSGACADTASEGQLTARVETPLGTVTTELFAITD